jgi:hypothetical protein
MKRKHQKCDHDQKDKKDGQEDAKKQLKENLEKRDL